MNEVPAASLAVIYHTKKERKTSPGKQRKFTALKYMQLEQLLHITTRTLILRKHPVQGCPLHITCILEKYYSNDSNWTTVKLIKLPSYLYCRNWEDFIYLGERKSPSNQLKVAAEFSVP